MSSHTSQTVHVTDNVSAHINYKTCMNDSLSLYDKLMLSVSNSKTAVLTDSELSREHEQNCNTAIRNFQATVKIGDEDLGRRYETELRKELDRKFEDYKNFNRSKHQNNLQLGEIQRLKDQQGFREREKMSLVNSLRNIRQENVQSREPKAEKRDEVPKQNPTEKIDEEFCCCCSWLDNFFS